MLRATSLTCSHLLLCVFSRIGEEFGLEHGLVLKDGCLAVLRAQNCVRGVALLHARVVLLVLVRVQHGCLGCPALRLRARLGGPRRIGVLLLELILRFFFTIAVTPSM